MDMFVPGGKGMDEVEEDIVSLALFLVSHCLVQVVQVKEMGWCRKGVVRTDLLIPAPDRVAYHFFISLVFR